MNSVPQVLPYKSLEPAQPRDHRGAFTSARMNVVAEMIRAEKLALTDTERAQAQAIRYLAGMIIHGIPMYPVPADFERRRGNLNDLVQAIDPLIEAIGSDVADNSYRAIDRTEFKDVLASALLDRSIPQVEIAKDACVEAWEER